eukprot:c9331_g1_i1 orf=61-243(+)
MVASQLYWLHLFIYLQDLLQQKKVRSVQIHGSRALPLFLDNDEEPLSFDNSRGLSNPTLS